MKKTVKLYLIILLICIAWACKSGAGKKAAMASDSSTKISTKNIATKDDNATPKEVKAEPGEKLLFQDETVASFVDSERRGAGVISFTLDVNDRLDIYDDDGTTFCYVILNEDYSYYTIDLPRKIVARKVVPTYDFAAFDFDAEPIKSDDQYLRIYVNKKLRKVKKSEAKYTFSSWEEYSKMEQDSTDAVND